MTELAFENLELCLNATTRNPKLWTPAKEGTAGFNEVECVILDEEPQYNLVQDVPVQQYKYFAMQPKYTGGEPAYDDSDDVIMDIYMFNYSVPVIDGEDWYLGHHVREGRISKQMGHRHYDTWKTIRVPDEPNSPLKPNRFYRITELGLPATAQVWPKPGDPPRARINYARSPLGNVLGEWRNIIIDPVKVQDLLK
jgi:hypothetical protein